MNLRADTGAIHSRQADILRNTDTTLDRLSHGRLVIQPTVSWHRDEYAAFGVPFERRGAVLDEVLGAMIELWGPSPASFHGEFFDFTDVYSEPKPFANGRPSMWFGG